MKRNRRKVCYILSYKSPDYIRTRVLLAALEEIDSVELSTAINTSGSLLRYPQTLWKLLKIRLTQRPQTYILGFRGQEIYWPVRLLTIGKPLIFDEFINMHDWLGEENSKLPKPIIKLADWYEKAVLSTCRYILTDTDLGAQSSSRDYGIDREKYRTIYVGTDESIFYPRPGESGGHKRLEVFFYGNMAPLHGIDHVLEAAKTLKNEPIHFSIAGGKGRPSTIKSIKNYIKANRLNNVSYSQWLNFNELPETIARADVFLGGPFGNTSQAKRVITGKTFQALAAGRTTIIGRIREEVGFEDKVNCLLIDQGSAAALAEAIRWASQNKSKLEEIGAAAAKLYQQKFGLPAVAKQLDLIIK